MHVLSTPPAFVLSQDQTLQKRIQNPADNIPTEVGIINQIKHLASTIHYDTLLSSQETVTRLVSHCTFQFQLFPLRCALLYQAFRATFSTARPRHPASRPSVTSPDLRPVVATWRTLGNRARRVKSRYQDPDAVSAGPVPDRVPRPPQAPPPSPRIHS